MELRKKNTISKQNKQFDIDERICIVIILINTMKVAQSDIQRFQAMIISRYDQNKRDLPRRSTNDPYHVLVSEYMAQQTQIQRVIPKYLQWLELFPNIKALAKANKLDLLKVRSWLWYNSRAIRLQKTAQTIRDKHNETVPSNYKDLIQLPGIGDYTANAILSFAFNKDVAVIDINIKRVLISNFNLDPHITKAELQSLAASCIPKGLSAKRHNALMDYGALVATSKKTWIKSPTQSKFLWSKRWVRWGILKDIIKREINEIEQIRNNYQHQAFDQILEEMKAEGIIQQKNSKIYINKKK